jgi:hypothetical protein
MGSRQPRAKSGYATPFDPILEAAKRSAGSQVCCVCLPHRQLGRPVLLTPAAIGIEPWTKQGTALDRPSEHIARNAMAGLGKSPDSYCNSMGSFQRVGSANPLNSLNCRTPPLDAICAWPGTALFFFLQCEAICAPAIRPWRDGNGPGGKADMNQSANRGICLAVDMGIICASCRSPMVSPAENGPQIDHRNPVNGCERACIDATENADFA